MTKGGLDLEKQDRSLNTLHEGVSAAIIPEKEIDILSTATETVETSKEEVRMEEIKEEMKKEEAKVMEEVKQEEAKKEEVKKVRSPTPGVRPVNPAPQSLAQEGKPIPPPPLPRFRPVFLEKMEDKDAEIYDTPEYANANLQVKVFTNGDFANGREVIIPKLEICDDKAQLQSRFSQYWDACQGKCRVFLNNAWWVSTYNESKVYKT